MSQETVTDNNNAKLHQGRVYQTVKECNGERNGIGKESEVFT